MEQDDIRLLQKCRGVGYKRQKTAEGIGMDNYIRKAAMTFAKEVKQSEVYQEYERLLARLKEQPELYGKVNEFRKRNFDIQNNGSPDNMMERLEELDREYAWLRENALVDDFLDAEVRFCRMMQEIDALIVGELDFQ